MDGELLRHLYHKLFHSGKVHVPRRGTFSDAVIVFIYFIAVSSDRSVKWAFDRSHWPLWARRLPRPSYSQLMRRLPTESVQACIDELNGTFRHRLPNSNDMCLDGKPLTVGVFTKDPDAAWGRLSNETWARGYKFHSLITSVNVIKAYAVTPLNESESSTALRLIAPLDLRGVVIRADASYDSNALYRAIAERGGRLIAPRRKPGRGLGHHPQHPDRLRAIELLERTPDGLRSHRRLRIRVEQGLAYLTNLPFGLAPLPNWVRRLHRVQRWIKAKVTLYHLNLSLAQTRTNVA